MLTKVPKKRIKSLPLEDRDSKVQQITEENLKLSFDAEVKQKSVKNKRKSPINEDFNSIEAIINRQFNNIDMSADKVRKASPHKIIPDKELEPELILDFKKQDKIHSFIQRNQYLETTQYSKNLDKPDKTGASFEKNQNIENNIAEELPLFKEKIWSENLDIEKTINFKSIFKSNHNLNVTKYKKELLFLVALSSIIFISVYFYTKSVNKTALNPLQKISLLAIMPLDETPKIYKILENAEILKNPLFKGIIVGDTVFIYEKNKQIYFFRESENKIVSIVQIN